jgi:hypothetical protein
VLPVPGWNDANAIKIRKIRSIACTFWRYSMVALRF